MRSVFYYAGLIFFTSLAGILNVCNAAADPTQPADDWLTAQRVSSPTKGRESDVSKRGITVTLTGASRRFALIDGQFIPVGARYNGVQVGKITPGRVWLDESGHALSISPAVEKKQFPITKRLDKPLVKPVGLPDSKESM